LSRRCREGARCAWPHAEAAPFADPQMIEDFRTFHNARAELRLVTQEVNQSWEREEAAKQTAEAVEEHS
jgi:hypothetical protein